MRSKSINYFDTFSVMVITKFSQISSYLEQNVFNFHIEFHFNSYEFKYSFMNWKFITTNLYWLNIQKAHNAISNGKTCQSCVNLPKVTFIFLIQTGDNVSENAVGKFNFPIEFENKRPSQRRLLNGILSASRRNPHNFALTVIQFEYHFGFFLYCVECERDSNSTLKLISILDDIKDFG